MIGYRVSLVDGGRRKAARVATPVVWLALCAASLTTLVAQSVRVVDAVVVGRAGDEASHQFDGRGTSTGTAAGATWRTATGWFAYTLRIWDDSPVTIVCVVADGDGSREAFDVIVDGRTAARIVRDPAEARRAEIPVRLKLKDTEGKRSVAVRLAAHAGARTARVLELRTLQEHLE